MNNPMPTVPIAANGLEGWSSCHNAAVTYHDEFLCCKECYEEVDAIPIDGPAGVELGLVIAAVIDGTMTPDQGVAEQTRILGAPR